MARRRVVVLMQLLSDLVGLGIELDPHLVYHGLALLGLVTVELVVRAGELKCVLGRVSGAFPGAITSKEPHWSHHVGPDGEEPVAGVTAYLFV